MSISKHTAKTIAPMLKSFAQSGVLPKSEVNAVVTIIREATKKVNSPKRSKSRLICSKEVAVRLGVCKKTVLRMRNSGLLTGILLTGNSKSLRFKETEVEQIIEGNIKNENNH